MQTSLALRVFSTFFIAAPALDADAGSLSPQERQAWIRHLVPLPKELELAGKLTLPVSRIRVTTNRRGQILLSQAKSELYEAIGKTTETPDAEFVIRIEVGGTGAAGLEKLRNSAQAYTVAGDAKGMRLSALTPVGAYYAAKTVKQLLSARARNGNVDVPIVQITDWPDMEDRGLWGTDNMDRIPWLSERKMNIVEQISSIGVDERGRPFAEHKKGRETLSTLGPKYAVKPVPVVLHLEQVAGKGVLKAHPELKGKSEHDGAMCYSQPAIVDVLAGWIVELGKLPGVESVDVWMAENLQGKGGCKCEACSKVDRDVLEARVIVAAWKKARRTLPKIGLRVLTSEETEDSNSDVFRELPRDVKIWYYHSLLTYTAGETPMLRKYLADFAAEGRWIGVCPNLVSIVHFAQPFTGAHFIHYRMSEFLGKGMSGLIGYVTPRLYYGFFNLEAAAEWSWNLKGRTTREFAASWAVRNGIEDPELFAEWSETVGPVMWDVVGSDWPNGEMRDTPEKVAIRLRKDELKPLGTDLWGVYRSPWADIKNEEQLDRDVAQADRALELARKLRRPECELESLVAQGYIRSIKALYELGKIVRSDGIVPGKREPAKRYFRMYVEGLSQVADALPKWERGLPMYKAGEDFAARPVGVIRESIERMRELAKDLGVAP